MSDDMSFGEIQVSQPELGRRPDQDPHLAVVEVGEPAAQQLRIYVDLATLRAIEAHLSHDTSIELGGVLLGGQFVDDEGQPFVIISEALDAQHYEATKGSFKFTHDTWQDLLQRTAKYPTTTRMVGWYHSHPGWGIFLSDMDLFICRGFFNNPLDVALVVDPCQDHRGWFHWHPATGLERQQRNSGFYLYDSRHRLPQLQRAADLLNEAESAMSSTQSFSTPSFPGSRSGMNRALARAESNESVSPAQVFISQPDQTWPLLFLGVMLSLQTILIAMIGWSVWTTPPATDSSAETRDSVYQAVLASLVERSDPESSPPVSKQRLDALLQRQQEVQELSSQNQLYRVAAEASQLQVQELTRQMENSNIELKEAHAINRDLDARIKILEVAQKKSAGDSQSSGDAGNAWWTSPWIGTGIGFIGLVAGGAIGGWWFSRRQAANDFHEKE